MKIDSFNIRLQKALNEHHRALSSLNDIHEKIFDSVLCMSKVLATGGCIFACGNGGSAADAQHFASELTGRFEKERRGYRACALTTDSSALTAIGNDFGFDFIYSRQLESLGQAGDLLLIISTSGNSKNVIQAVNYARSNDIRSIGLLGRNGGSLATLVDLPLIIPVQRTARIQETHIFILHLICELLEADA